MFNFMKTNLSPLLFIPIFIAIAFVSVLSAQEQSREPGIMSANFYLQSRGEVYFRIKLKSKADIHNLTKIISIDKTDNNFVYAYANNKQFTNFSKLNLNYEILPPPSSLKQLKMSKSLKDVYNWDTYPTYEQYINMMYEFESNYPGLCKVYNIGTSVEGRDILFVKISDNTQIKEAEPGFLYSSTMHGNETTGYILMLRYINYLLSNYDVAHRIKYLIDNIELWINPLSNPDGTYSGGDSTVNGATRFNANNIDLNRNFPDPEDGLHPDGENWQPETVAMMNFMEERNFVLSANFHTGSEVVNYPWDTWKKLHADDDWYKYISHQYADTAQAYSPAGYLNGFDDGITNGYAWYSINGGRQDYVNYYLHSREVTIELSNTNIPDGADLPAYWEYNYRSFVNYMEQCLYGINGIVTDSISGKPLPAKIKVLTHDFDSSFIYSDSINGNYYRLIYQGTYDLKFSAPGYYTKTIYGVQAINRQSTHLDVKLVPIIKYLNVYNRPNPFKNSTDIIIELPEDAFVQIKVFDITGKQVSDIVNKYFNKGSNTVTFDASQLNSGVYIYRVEINNFIINKKMLNVK